MIGYIVEAYEDNISNMYENIRNKQNVIDAFNATYQIFEIMGKMNNLANLGIVVSHRDMTATNIMYLPDPNLKNKFKIRLIDFGFMCSDIKFKDGTSVVIGYHPSNPEDVNLHLCNNQLFDIVLFISWCIRYNSSYLIK